MAKSKPAPKKETTQEAGKRSDLEAKEKRIKDSVSSQVLKSIGTPRNLRRVDVHLYQPGRARINIWQANPTKELITTGIEITDSHYLWLTKEAKIKKSNPPMEAKY